MVLNSILLTAQKLGFLHGIYSALIKFFIAIIRFYFVFALCRLSTPEIFKQNLFFLSILSIVPFLDLGIGGGQFRLRMIEAMKIDLQNSKEVLFDSFFRLLKLFFIYSIVFSIILFCSNTYLSPVAFVMIFLRVPFSLFTEFLFSENKMELAYLIELLEQLCLVFVSLVAAKVWGIGSIQLTYSLSYFLFTFSVFFIFINKKNWKLEYVKKTLGITKKEIYFCIHTILTNSFFLFIMVLANYKKDALDLFEFNIGFRILGLVYGASLVVLNPVWNKIIKSLPHLNPKDLDHYLILMIFVGFVGSVFFFGFYPYFFSMVAGFYPLENTLKIYLSFWIFLIFLFLALDIILKTFCIKKSVILWVFLYLGGLSIL